MGSEMLPNLNAIALHYENKILKYVITVEIVNGKKSQYWKPIEWTVSVYAALLCNPQTGYLTPDLILLICIMTEASAEKFKHSWDVEKYQDWWEILMLGEKY